MDGHPLRLACAGALWLVLETPLLDAQAQKLVLMVWGGRIDLPANITVHRAIQARLYQEFGPDVDIRFEYVDAGPDADREARALRDYVLHKHEGRHFDVLIAIAGPAIDFARTYGPDVFPGVPIVCWTGWPDPVADPGRGPPFTAAVGSSDPRATVDFILRLQPATRRLVVVHGGTPYDYPPTDVRQTLRGYEDRLDITYLIGRPFEEVRRRVAQLPPQTAILYVRMFGDGTGRRLVSVDALAAIAEAANAPVYSGAASYLGTGVIGGVMVDQERVADAAADLAVRVLRGTPVQGLPMVRVPSVPMADWRQLRRWGIPERRLPEGTVVRFRQPSLWQAYRWHVAGALTVCLAQGALIAALVLQRGRRRRADARLDRAERAAQEQVRAMAHLSRVAMMGELSGALAHELNQPLTSILSNAQAARRLLDLDPPDLEEVQAALDDIVTEDKRAGEVIRHMRVMLKRTDGQQQLLDVNDVIREALDLARGDLSTRGVTASADLARGLAPVWGDRVQLQQVLLNLILNGCDAMNGTAGPERRLTVATAHGTAGEVELRVTDRGTGIPDGVLERIFDPFITSKAEGLGLGLAICRTIVRAHGGRLWATNNCDRAGATFHVALPVAAAGTLSAAVS